AVGGAVPQHAVRLDEEQAGAAEAVGDAAAVVGGDRFQEPPSIGGVGQRQPFRVGVEAVELFGDRCGICVAVGQVGEQAVVGGQGDRLGDVVVDAQPGGQAGH